MEESYIQSAIDIFMPVQEASIVLAAHYCKNCNRRSITREDIQLGMKYAARTVLGNQIGSLYPEIYEDDEEEEEEEEDEEEEEFTTYQGDDETCLKMNECSESWSEWVPDTPVGKSLKSAIDKADVQE
jgi:hypothetical protein